MGSIIDGQPVNASVTNTSKLDRQTDDTAFGVITLANPSSGDNVTNVQQAINDGWQNEKLFVLVDNDGTVSWDGSSLSFSEDIRIVSKDFSIENTIVAANSPLSIPDGFSVYVTLNRSASVNVTPFIVATPPKGGDILRLCTRDDMSLIFCDNTYVQAGQSVRIGASGSGGSGTGTIKATLFDPVSTTLPTGTGATIDGVTLTNSMTVLFTNLTTNPNRVYMVSGVGVSLVWTAQTVFNGLVTPSDGDSVRVLTGNGFADQLAVYDGTTFYVNDKIRMFNGVDYFEINKLVTSTLTDNTTGNVFTVAYSGSENLVINYSAKRGSLKQVGQLLVVTDGTTVNVSDATSPLGDVGLDLFGDISGANLRLRYTTTNTGTNVTMKYFITRWSDASGGPGGVPSYTGGSPVTPAAGSDTEVQFNDGGNLGADSAFTWDKTNNILSLNGFKFFALQTGTLTNNVASPAAIITLAKASYRHLLIEYSIARDTNYRTGTLSVVHDDTNASLTDSGASMIGDTEIIFDAVISGSNLVIRYVSTNTGFNGNFKYLIKGWI
jgi:hypothetical protein